MMLAMASYNNAMAQDVGYLCNPPLPYMPVKLDILFIGNSFSIDTSSALPSILESLGVSTVNVYVLYKGGCSMKQHYEYFMGNKPVYELYNYNYLGERKISNSISLNEVISTYTYKMGLQSMQYSFSTAVNLMNTLVNFVMLFLVNFIARKTSEYSLW